MGVRGNLETIREQASLAMIIEEEEPDTETWLNQEYAEQYVGIGIWNLSGRKSHGGDGIQGYAYKETGKWAIGPIAKIANHIRNGHAIPGNWTHGKIVYI